VTESPNEVFRHTIRFLLGAAVVAVLGQDGAHAQQNTITGYNQVLGQWDASQAARTNVNRGGTGSPNGRDQCNRLGESYFQTDAAAGQTVWYCTSLPSTWTNVAGVPSGASLPATCTVGQLFFNTTAGASFGLNQCAATNSWSALGGGGVSYQGAVTAGSPVVAVSSSKIASLTSSTACTTGFTGLYPAICATLALTGQGINLNGNLQCGGATCPAGLYDVRFYSSLVASGTGGGNLDISFGWTDSAGSQTQDSGTMTLPELCVPSCNVNTAENGQLFYSVYSTGTANITYSTTIGGSGSPTYSLYISLERLQ